MSKNNFTGYVLAGGKSSRMGTDKAFLEIKGKTFLENAVEILKLNCRQVKIVLNKSQNYFVEKISVDVSHIFDIFEDRGALGGIHAALTDCETEFAIILAVDLPFVSSKTIENLSKFAVKFEKSFAFIPQQNDGRFQPLCAIYRTRYCLPEIENLLQTEKFASVNFFLSKIPAEIIKQEKLNNEKDVFVNVNNPQDFQIISKNEK